MSDARWAVISLTANGAATGQRIVDGLAGEARFYAGRTVEGKRSEDSAVVGEGIADLWTQVEGLVLVMAAGIAVRTIAPLLASKKADPAVVVVDEVGRHAVSLIGGHLAGANDLAVRVADILGGRAVITTSSDVQGLPGLDLWAKAWGLRPEQPKALDRAAAALVNGERLGLYTDLPGQAWSEVLEKAGIPRLPLSAFARPAPGVFALVVTDRLGLSPQDFSAEALMSVDFAILRPMRLVAGVGCRRGTAPGELDQALEAACREAQVSTVSLATMASIVQKQDEAAIQEVARERDCELVFFKPEELALADVKNPSEFVLETVGVEGVCEPAALLASGSPELLLGKSAWGKVTIALAQAAWPS